MTYMIAICRTYAKGFGAVGAIFAGSECVIEKTRAKHDIYNSVYAGCFTGGALAARAGPQVHFCLSVCLLICLLVCLSLCYSLLHAVLVILLLARRSHWETRHRPGGSPRRDAFTICTFSGHVRRLRHLRGVLSHDRQVHGARLSAGQGCSPAVRIRRSGSAPGVCSGAWLLRGANERGQRERECV